MTEHRLDVQIGGTREPSASTLWRLALARFTLMIATALITSAVMHLFGDGSYNPRAIAVTLIIAWAMLMPWAVWAGARQR